MPPLEWSRANSYHGWANIVARSQWSPVGPAISMRLPTLYDGGL
ncbi:MAG: hypothetical protein QGI68_11300 [Pseudomonadales bacterium]|jgi:hypothetical protein|nr:hypothetical protein [Pseudomonadales bacterium]HJN50688.1 hypothetical protein [Pseudomonadales bacterium]